MRSPEQLKGWARNVAAEKHLRAQEILQMFMFERLLERLAASPYQKNFILKGGLLISSMVGLEGRTTMDMDTTVRGIHMEEEEIVSALKPFWQLMLVTVSALNIVPLHRSVKLMHTTTSAPILMFCMGKSTHP